MEEFLLALRILLALIFGIAGITKLMDLDGTRKSLVDFDVPAIAVPIMAILLPIAEIIVAICVLFVKVSWFGSIGALLLLAAFSGGMIVQIVRGNAPACHCFGQLHSEPVGKKSLVRNILFMLPAATVAAAGPQNQGLAVSQMSQQTVQLFMSGAIVLLLAFVIAHLRKIANKQEEIVKRLDLADMGSFGPQEVKRDEAGDPRDGLPIGAPFPGFELTDENGESVDDDTFRRRQKPAILIFVNPSCGPCRTLIPRSVEWAAELASRIDVFVISSGNADENKAAFDIGNTVPILIQKDQELANSVGAQWNPTGLLVSSDGRIASHIAAGDTAIERLVEKIRSREPGSGFDFVELRSGEETHSRIRIGEEIPDFAVTGISGERITGDDLRGMPTLVAFWSPGCGHCVAMVDQFRNWDNVRQKDDPKLLIFSDGDLDFHREIGIRSPIVIDRNYRTAQKLGMLGTPSAILIGRDGRFASELAIGAPNIWALVGRRVHELN